MRSVDFFSTATAAALAHRHYMDEFSGGKR
jgi:hypothetical protein